MAAWHIFPMWQPYFFSGIKYLYSEIGIDLNMYMHAYIFTCSMNA